jgi:hypothetical protein
MLDIIFALVSTCNVSTAFQIVWSENCHLVCNAFFFSPEKIAFVLHSLGWIAFYGVLLQLLLLQMMSDVEPILCYGTHIYSIVLCNILHISQYHIHTTSKSRASDEWWIWKDLKEDGLGLLDLLHRDRSWGTETNCDLSDIPWPVMVSNREFPEYVHV